MALATTTLSTAVATTDTTFNLVSVTSIVVGRILRLDGEWAVVSQAWGTSQFPTSGTLVPVLRGKDGSAVLAHPKSANVVHGVAGDFMLPPVQVAGAVTNPVQPANPIYSYSAAGALTLGGAGAVGPAALHIINGTSGLAMTIAAPTADMDGQEIRVASNGKAAHTLAVSGNNGIGNAGAGYRTLTWAAGAKITVHLTAVNGDWLPDAVYGGTTTNVQIALS